MKRNRTYILITIVLAVIAIVLVLTNSKSTFKRSLSDFAVDDTATITKIFISDKNNNTLLLTRVDSSKWTVGEKYAANKVNVELLLKTLLNVQVREPVAKKAYNTIIRDMAVSAYKVEVYQRVYRIRLFGLVKWFPHEKRTKVFYVGGATPSNVGTYMLMENSSEPYITFLPGLRGFLTPRFTPIEKYWRDYAIFKKDIGQITKVRVEFPANPEYSYEVQNDRNRSVKIISLIDNKELQNFDTLRLFNFLTSFRNINFEAILNDMDQHRKDSILAATPFHIISLTDTSGVTNTIRTYHKGTFAGAVDMEGNPVMFDNDRMYALVNNGQDFVIVQFYSFDRITRKKSYFEKTSKTDQIFYEMLQEDKKR
jgi:hypothetical protein